VSQSGAGAAVARMIGPTGMQVMSNVKRLREARGLSTEKLAAAVVAIGRPMHATAITKVEKGQRRVDVDDLMALATVLGVTPAYLLVPPAECATCHGAPPPGFACTKCGTTAPKVLTEAEAEDIKTRWLHEHGNPHAAHKVELIEDREPGT
jgi:transcriptional regulator with XRE-family HTH domain